MFEDFPDITEETDPWFALGYMYESYRREKMQAINWKERTMKLLLEKYTKELPKCSFCDQDENDPCFREPCYRFKPAE